MVNLIYIKNPFDLSSREIKQVEFIPEIPLSNYIKHIALFDESTISVAVNGTVTKDLDTIISDGDYIIVSPKVEDDFFGLLASIALTFVAFGVGGWASGLKWGAAASSWTIGGYLAAAAVMFIGGQLINPMNTASVSEWEQSTTYGWNTMGNLVQQGSAVPVTYGRVRVAGQVIAQHVQTIDNSDKQYLNVLLCGGEGLVDSISDIEINNTPINYYNDVEVDLRYGENIQTVIGSFGETYADTQLNYELKNDLANGTNGTWHTHRTEGDAGNGLELTFEFPNGLFYANDNGSLGNVTVQIQAQYKLATEGDDKWKTLYHGNKITWSSNDIKNNYLSYLSLVDDVNETWTFTGINGVAVDVYRMYNGYYDSYYIEKATCYKQYRVVGSVSGEQPVLTVGAAYNNGYISMKLNDVANAELENSYYKTTGRPLYSDSICDVPSFTLKIEGNPTLSITASTNSAIRRVTKLENLADFAQYDVRCKCIYKSGTSNRYGTRVFWTQLSHIMTDDFTYPNKVLVGIKALATSQLSGGKPTITWIQERGTVKVHDPNLTFPPLNPQNGFDFVLAFLMMMYPDGAIYAQKPANNPAWACYDILHRARTIKDPRTKMYITEVQGIDRNRLIYSDFKKWADYCTLKGLTVNIHFDVTDGLWEQLARIEILGRGKVVFRGTKIGCIFDAPSDPVQLFTVSNIYSDSFSEDFISLNNIANAVEVTFFNKDNNYKQEIVTIYGDSFDSTDKLTNISQLTLYGCVTRDDAIKHGRYLLRTSNNLIRTINIEVDVDAIACQVGDVISVQHDVPQWGVGGRIIGYEESSFGLYLVKLDKEVTFSTGKTYRLLSRFINSVGEEVFEDVAVVNPSTDGADRFTDEILVSPFSYSVVPYNHIFSFGEAGKVKKDFRVLDITRSKEMKRKINAIEYIPQVYNDSATIPYIGSYTSLPVAVPPRNVKASPTFVVQPGGTVLSGINVSWELERNTFPSSYVIYTSTDGGGYWHIAGRAYGTSHTLYNLPLGTYSIGVSAVYNEGYYSQSGIIHGIELTEKQIPPSDVRNFNATIDGSIIVFTWDAVANPDLLEYHIKQGDSWDTGTLIAKIPKGTTTYSYIVMNEGSRNFWIKAIDTSGNYSINEDFINFIVGDTIYPDNVTGFDVEQLI